MSKRLPQLMVLALGVVVLGYFLWAGKVDDPLTKQLGQFIATQNIDRNAPGWKTRLPRPPAVAAADGLEYYWELETSEGPIQVRLYPEWAPYHVVSTAYLTMLGFYDDIAFHRVIPGFMAQGGCPLGTGTAGPGYTYAGEFSEDYQQQQLHDRPGLLSMANTGQPNSDGSQFFLTFAPAAWLNGKHTVFGEVTGGMDTLMSMQQFGSSQGKTSKTLYIKRATITVR